MANKLVENKTRWERAISLSQMGWWEVNNERKCFVLSDFIARLMNLKEGCNEISFEDFRALIAGDFRERSDVNSFFCDNEGNDRELRLPLSLPAGEVWVLIRETEPGCDDKEKCRMGMLQLLGDRDLHTVGQTDGERVKELLKRQTTLSNALLAFFGKHDTMEAIGLILEEMRRLFGADRAYIFEFNEDYSLENCIYEVTDSSLEVSYKDMKLEVEKDEEWIEQLRSGKNVLISDITQISSKRNTLREQLERNGVHAVVLLPLVSIKGMWGFVGIEFIKQTCYLNHDNDPWLSSIANIISICVWLRKAIDETTTRENYFKWILSNMPAGIEIYDENATMIDVNEKDLEIFGVENKNDLLGINLFEHPLATGEIKEKLKAGETINLAFDYTFDKMRNYYNTPKGGTRALITQIMALKNELGKITNYMILVVDNTENRNAQSRVVEFEEFFSLVGDYAKVGYARYNILTGEGYASESWYNNIGESRSKPLEEVFVKMGKIYPEEWKLIEEFLEGVKDGTQKDFRENIRIDRGEGKYSWTCTHVLVRDYRPQEGTIELVSINYDITELKELEKDLIVAKEKADEANRLKSAFLANMSHEIRTPLNAIVGFSNVLAEAESEQEREEYLSIIENNNELLLQLVSDILDLSKIEAGTLEFNYSDVDLNNMINEITHASRLRSANEKVNIEFVENLPDCFVHTERNRVTQVIINFVNNAMKFTSEGSIRIGYRLQEEDDMLYFFVSDTGRGIAKEKLSQVFERFVKLDSMAQGTGLGLTICSTIIERLGGKIGVESEEGKGSTFWFTIPYAPVENPNKIKKLHLEHKECVPRDNLTILIAEDNPGNYKLYETILGKEYHLLHAWNGEEAVKLYCEHRPHLILMDIRMPGIDGYEATRRIRKISPKVPIIAVTAFTFGGEEAQILSNGFDAYAAKPVKMKSLKDKIKDLLQGNIYVL